MAPEKSLHISKCHSCATLQAAQVPEDLSRYYPPGYLGPVSDQQEAEARPNSVRLFLKQQRVLYMLYGKNPLGWLASKIGEDYFGYTWEWFRKAGATPASRILDVGCGPGLLLKNLQYQGFSNLSGVDPFQEKTHPGLNIHRTELNELAGQYDFIMLHHSLEHMPDPAGALANSSVFAVRAALSLSGFLLPVAMHGSATGYTGSRSMRRVTLLSLQCAEWNCLPKAPDCG